MTIQEKIVTALKRAGQWHEPEPEPIHNDPVYSNRKERRAAEATQRKAARVAARKAQAEKEAAAAPRIFACSGCDEIGVWGDIKLCPICQRDLLRNSYMLGVQSSAFSTPKRLNGTKVKRPPPVPATLIRIHDHPSPPMPKHLQALDVRYERPTPTPPKAVRPIAKDLELEVKNMALEKALAQVRLGTAPGTLLFDDSRHMYVAAEFRAVEHERTAPVVAVKAFTQDMSWLMARPRQTAPTGAAVAAKQVPRQVSLTTHAGAFSASEKKVGFSVSLTMRGTPIHRDGTGRNWSALFQSVLIASAQFEIWSRKICTRPRCTVPATLSPFVTPGIVPWALSAITTGA